MKTITGSLPTRVNFAYQGHSFIPPAPRAYTINILDAEEWGVYATNQGWGGLLAPHGVQVDQSDGSALCVVDGSLSHWRLVQEVAHELGHAVGLTHPGGYGFAVRVVQILHAVSIGFGTMAAGWPLRLRDPEGLLPIADAALG